MMITIKVQIGKTNTVVENQGLSRTMSLHKEGDDTILCLEKDQPEYLDQGLLHCYKTALSKTTTFYDYLHT